MVADLPGMGRWVRMYSSLERLSAQEGATNWMSMLGAEAIDLLPPDIGLVLDPHLSHAAAIPPRTASTIDPTLAPPKALPIRKGTM